jgi:aspartyl-tRNA(Asn)/glutamyl-tRNA(Gln) amidotransferase subunit C
MVDKKTVEYVAQLARIDILESQKQYLAEQLSSIIEYIDNLKELDVSGIEPLRELHTTHNIFRNDTSLPSACREKILQNAPVREEDYFKIPKVIA